jgi:hypothetical protein
MGKFQFGFGVGILLGLCSATAAAQSVTISGVTRVVHELPGGGTLPENQINFADCSADDPLTLTLALQDYQELALEVWAGTACEALTNRLGPTATCWRVYTAQPTSETHLAEIRIRDLLLGRTRAGLASELEQLPDSAACESASKAIAPQVLTVFAMLVDASAQVVSSTTWKATYRLSGSRAPARVSASSSDRQLLVDFSYESSPMPEDQFISSFELFCDPPPNDPNAVANAVTLDDAGMPPECPVSSELVPGASAAALQHLRCGSASQVTLSGTADGLVNGVSYNVAVASVDTFGNVGPLSPLACQAPQAKPALDASSGACSFAGTRGAAPGFALTTLGLLGGALARRRRRNRAQRS